MIEKLKREIFFYLPKYGKLFYCKSITPSCSRFPSRSEYRRSFFKSYKKKNYELQKQDLYFMYKAHLYKMRQQIMCSCILQDI